MSNGEPGDEGLHEAEVETRWEAGPAILLVIALQIALTVVSRWQGWELWRLPWWWWLVVAVPEAMLAISLTWARPRHQLEEMGRRRTAALVLIGLIVVANGVALVGLIISVLLGEERSGTELLFKGITVWTTNVITFGLCYWALDGGGPVRRRESDPPPADFQFPQLENPQLAAPGWHPRIFDYAYISFTNALAFSPTDAMPLTHRAKWLMLIESAASAMTVLVIAARAVNILR
jgi:uncharacterized membrane protein